MAGSLIGLSALEEGRVYAARGETDAAIRKLSEALNEDFYQDEALFMLGAVFIGSGMNGLGAVLTSAAVDARAVKKRAFPEALMNLGAAYKAEHQNETAERIWKDALKHETLPRERAKILCNLSGLFVNEGRPEKAIPYCDEALREDPNNYGARANRGVACLELGRWKEGWDGWRATLKTGDRQTKSYPGVPEWDGSPGKTVIVWGDQGVGDEIFYAWCLKDMAKVCRKVIFDCHPRLESLFKRTFPEFEVHGTRKDLTTVPWVEHCGAEAAVGLADLPYHFRSDGGWGGTPYLRAAEVPELTYKSTDRPLRIGISWTGGSKRTRTDLRSMPLDIMEPIIRAKPEAQWFSLQYTPEAAREVCRFEEKTGIRIAHYPGWVECNDYDRTASFVASLDLIITVCTTVHHLGGALGIPTWTLVPSRPSWRYGVRGDTLPWYGSARLFRQEKDGDWSGPVERIAEELRGMDAHLA
jgi:tetratricopeptide (TPR) repeat protein